MPTRVLVLGSLLLLLLTDRPAPGQAKAPPFQLAPALAVEAEDFQIESGWKVVKNGQGNYMVDIIGFNHISGERLLSLDGKADAGAAFLDVTLPEAGPYRLWVRYEYPSFCETRFQIVIEQDGKKVFEQTAGSKDSPRYAYGSPEPKAQPDPSWGPEGLMEEAFTTPELKAGKARLWLRGVAQPQTPGVAANRNVDLLYLSRDLNDSWFKHYKPRTTLYPLLDAFRDTRGPRYTVRFTNRGTKPNDYRINYVYNRLPWYGNEGAVAKGLKPGETSDEVPLKNQDTTHWSLVQFFSAGEPLDVEIRADGKVLRKLSGASPVLVYLPPYPGKDDGLVTPIEQIDLILQDLAKHKAPGKTPTQPLCYGGWLPLGQDNDYGRKYAQLYAALGLRSLHPAHSGPAALKNLEAVGIAPTRSWAASGYRNPPLPQNIEKAKTNLQRAGMDKYLLWFDYGDEISFSEWMSLLVQHEVARAKAANQNLTPAAVVNALWMKWLQKNRPTAKLTDYWLEKWGNLEPIRMKPDSSAEAAQLNPKLYVDSLLFYEDVSIAFVAAGARTVREAFGPDVLCGANYSCHPFYYPSSTMYIKWFRGGAADVGRHSEYFWQVAQAGPMINGYIAEHFRSGLRNTPNGVIRQYTMPHAPGNTDANFQRTAYSHLAHGATNLDFFGIGLNETFTENYIDGRALGRFRALRDVTHAIGFVEDLLPKSKPLASPVALLVSESTERWDFAGIARDYAGHAHFGPEFRKTRLHFHLERLGLWKALTFLGVSPDLLIETDLTADILKDYKVLVVVGDCLPPTLVPVLEKWVRQGGVLLATANAGRHDAYRQPDPGFANLCGLSTRRTEERTTFIRPRQELPFLEPVGQVVGEGWKMPQLATLERITVGGDGQVLASFADDKTPAVVTRKLDKGQVVYVAALPGVAYLWSGLQPPPVPDRGPNTHTIPTAWDAGARSLLQGVLKLAAVEPLVVAEPALIDGRILKAPTGYIVPLANYHQEVGQKVTLTLRLPSPIKEVLSAAHGKLEVKQEGGKWIVTLPALGYGDILRLVP